MPKNTIEEKYRWIKPILDDEISIKKMVMVCPFSERSLKYWLSNYRRYGFDGLKNHSRRPKSNSLETPIRVKERIIELRKETKLCGLKLSWKLKKEGIDIHERTVNKIIKKEGLTRRYRIRKAKYGYIKTTFKPGELVEIDIKFVPKRLKNERFYQFTAIDCSSRWRYLKIYDQMTNSNMIKFLKVLIKQAPFEIKAIKTDNGAYFTNRYTGYLKSADPINPNLHAFDLFCEHHQITHYLIDPGKPAQNGHVERSHRSDQEHFYDQIRFKSLDELQYKLRLWNMYYNDLEHCSLDGLSPNQALNLRVQYVCS